MLPEAPVVAGCQRGRVHEAEGPTRSAACLQVGAQGYQHRRNQIDKAGVTDQCWKLGAQMDGDIRRVVRLEGAIVGLVEMDQDGHHLARRQVPGLPTRNLPHLPQAMLPGRSKRLPKIIDSTK